MNTPAMNVSAATIARPARRRWHRTGWGAMTALILVTLAFVSKYVGMNPANFLVQQREVYLAHETMLALHICGASTAVAIGPFQFLPALRRDHARVHRTVGIT